MVSTTTSSEKKFKELMEEFAYYETFEDNEHIKYLKGIGWQYAIRNHTYINRLFSMFSIMRGLK